MKLSKLLQFLPLVFIYFFFFHNSLKKLTFPPEQMARVYGSSAQPFTSPQFWENFVGEITSLSVSPLAKRFLFLYSS